MSESTATAAATETEATTEQQTSEQAKPTETVDFWKQKAREQEKRAKENADAARRLAEIEDAQKTEAQRTAEKLAEAERAATEARVRAIRAEVAALKGVPAQLLTGTTEAEIEESAAELLKFRGDVRPDFGAGSRGKAVGGERAQWTRSDLKGKTTAEIEAARREGLLDRVMGKRAT